MTVVSSQFIDQLIIMLMTTTVHGYYHGHFNHKNIKARKSVLECVEKRVSHSLLDQRFYCMVKLEKLVHH